MHPSHHSSQWAGGPATHNKVYASTFQEQDSLFNSYEHLTQVPHNEEGLIRLRKIASLVKPIMRKRGWQVRVLTEFMPTTQNLLGLNINRGYKICIRLRYSHAPATFLPFEQTVDTMLHELSHIVWGPHDANFHALWDELREEYETLLLRGYTGEGFLSKGSRLGGGRVPPQTELRRLARANAERRKVLQKGSGQRIGGNALHANSDIRQVIADAAERRNKIDKGCASGTAEAGRLAELASQQTFTTKAEEDDANNRAIAEALLGLMEEDEARKMHSTFTSPPPSGGLGWTPTGGLYSADNVKVETSMSEEQQMKWALQESLKTTKPPTGPVLAKEANGERCSSLKDSNHRVRGPKRAKSDHAAASVLRFQNHEKLLDLACSTTGPSIPIDLTHSDAAVARPASETWTCEICTCINPSQFLACDACAIERPQTLTAAGPLKKVKPVPPPPREDIGWYCRECATFMEHKYWTCSACGLMKDTS